MDVLSFIQNNGMKVVDNPNYNPKSKFNIEPKKVVVPNLKPGSNNAVNMAIVDFNNQYSISEKENEKYRKYGLNYNPHEDMNLQLAEAQSAWKKWGNAIAQTLVSEIGIGTVKAGSDLIDFMGQALKLSDPDYSNPVSQFLEQKQEEFKQFAPIYSDPSKNIFNGGLLDAGWWASNIPSIASSLTLFVPALGVTKLAQAARIGQAVSYGKRFLKPVQEAARKAKLAQTMREAGESADAIKAATNLTFWQKTLTSPTVVNAANVAAENITTAALNRTMENYQEARQTYNDMYLQASEVLKNISNEDYQKVLDKNSSIFRELGTDTTNRDEVAKAIAKKSADETFRLDFLNVGWDILQLYALRGLFKGQTPSVSSAKIRRANIDSQKYAGKTPQQIAEIKAKRTKWEKTKEFLEDKTIGSGLVIGAEASEGAEEALNYIAQQEGMHLGGVMAGTIDDEHNTDFWSNVASGFDGRLKDYVAAPALWDSAFWGVMGGVVFQGAGSKLKQISQTLKNRDNLTKEEREKIPWYQFDQLPQVKARITDIQNRAIRAQQYKSQLDLINQGNDIYHSTKESQVHFASEAEADVARKKLRDEMADELMLDAMQVGNGDMLKAYWQNDNVRQAMVENGFFDDSNNPNKTTAEKEAESKQFVQDILQQMEKVEEMYNQELVAVGDIVGAINIGAKHKDKIPAEYTQIIANKNVRAELAGEIIDKSIAGINATAAQITKDLINKGELDASVDYENSVRLGLLIQPLGQLRAQRRVLANKEKSLTNTIAIKNIDKQINSIEFELQNSYSQAALTYAINSSLQYVLNDDGKTFRTELTPESQAYYDSVITNRVINGMGKDINLEELIPNMYLGIGKILDDAEVGEFNTIRQDVDRNIRQLEQVSPGENGLINLYNRKVGYEFDRIAQKNKIIRNYNEVLDYTNELHNTMNESRKKVINQAYTNIRNLYKGNPANVLEILNKLNNGETLENVLNKSNLTDDEKSTIIDSFDALAITDKRNSNIAESIINALDMHDRAEQAAAANNPNNNNSTNPTNRNQPAPQPTPVPSNPPQPNPSQNQPSQPTQSPQLTNPPSQPQNAPTQPPTQPQSQSQQQIDPQNIANKPISYKQSVGAINGINASNQIDFYDNGDGTFTINPDNYPNLFKESTLYENADSIDLLAGKVDSEIYPIVRRNTNGSYDIVSKGIAKVTPFAPQPSGNNTPSAPSTPANPSTGEGGNLSGATQQGQTSQDDGLSNVKLDDLTQLNITANVELINIFKTNITNSINPEYDVTIDKIELKAAQLVNDAVLNGIDRQDAMRTVSKIQFILIKKINALKNKTASSLLSSIDDIFISQTDLVTANRNNYSNAVKQYRDIMYQMLNQYVAERGLQSFDGKHYIHLEDLLRYINQITNDSNMAQSIFESLKQQLLTEETKKKFVIIDENEINKNNFWDNVAKSAEQRLAEKESENLIQDVDINRILSEATNDEELETIFKTLESLHPGDKLSFEIDKTKKRIYIKNNNGNRVGTMPVPTIDSATGAYLMPNDGWNYDIIPTNNGNIKSDIYNLFVNWFTTQNDSTKELFSILYEYAFSKPSKERKAELIKQFGNNIEIIKAKNKGFTTTNATDEQLLKGLVKLVNYIKDTAGDEIFSRTNSIIRRRSLNNWFNKLQNSYDLTVSMYNNPNGNFDLQVKSVGLGDIIRVYDNVKPEDRNKLPLVNDAIAGGVNTSINKVAITDPNNLGNLMVAGLPNQKFNGIQQGNTFVLIPDNAGTFQFVQAWPIKANEATKGSKSREIFEAIKQEAHKLFDEYAKNSTPENRSNIESFFKSLVHIGNGNSTLFNRICIAELKNKNGFNINLPGTNNVIVVYNNVQVAENDVQVGIGNKQYVGINSKEFKDKLDAILNGLQYRFAYAHLQSDNNTNIQLNGIAKRINGKFVITIGEQSWEFDSFNDFILGENLVRLNTKVVNGSNFNRSYTRNTNIEQTFKIEIVSPSSSPVEDSVEAPQSKPTQQTTSVRERVLAAINSNVTNKGEAIFNSIIGTDELFNKTTLASIQKLHLLPENVKFDLEFNNRRGFETINAAYNPKTKQIIVGEKWLNMLENPLTRKEAIRKLIHEQIHHLLNQKDKKAVLNSIQEVFNEFKSALNDENVVSKLTSIRLDVNHLKEYLFENNPNALEEFIIESLTSEELATALNNIEAKGYKKGRIANLFQKILDALAKLFNWGVKQGSLYEKELYSIRTTFSKTETVIEEVTPTETPNVVPTETPIQIPTEEKPIIIEQSTVENKPKEFGDNGRRSRNRERSKFSSITESNITINNDNKLASNVPSIESFTERLPVNQQAKFASLVTRSEVSTSCR